MNWGKVAYTNRTTNGVSEADEYRYFNCRNCRRNNSALLKVSAINIQITHV